MHFTEFKIFLTRGAVGHSEEVSPWLNNLAERRILLGTDERCLQVTRTKTYEYAY